MTVRCQHWTSSSEVPSTGSSCLRGASGESSAKQDRRVASTAVFTLPRENAVQFWNTLQNTWAEMAQVRTTVKTLPAIGPADALGFLSFPFPFPSHPHAQWPLDVPWWPRRDVPWWPRRDHRVPRPPQGAMRPSLQPREVFRQGRMELCCPWGWGQGGGLEKTSVLLQASLRCTVAALQLFKQQFSRTTYHGHFLFLSLIQLFSRM